MDVERQRRLLAILRESLDGDKPVEDLCGDDETLAADARRLLGHSSDSLLDRDAASLASALVDADDDQALPAGTIVGAWRVLRDLGAGGMGSVHLVERHGDGYVQQGALKLIKRGMDSQELVMRFRRERGILSRLDHPNIARLLDGGIAADGRSFLVMEFVDGQTLDTWSARQDASPMARATLFRAICAAVAHAHHQLVVHRDIKPGNVMVTRDGQPKLLDFGIAKVLGDDDGEATRTVHAPLSRAYAAPEQVAAGPITTATDIYQLGLLLQHLFGGSGALRGDGAIIVARATDAEPRRRYSTVEGLADDVRRWHAGLPILARADSSGYRLRRFIARHRFAVALVALAVLALVGGSTAALWQAQRAEHEARIARASQAFLASVFDAAAPDAEAGARVTARDLLDRGSERIESDPTDSPQLRAELLGTFGTLYRQLGQFDRAETLLARALVAWPDMEDAQRQQIAIQRAGIARELDRLDGAQAMLEPVLSRPVTRALEARALAERAQVHEQRGDYEAAVNDARAAATLDAARGPGGRVDHADDRQIEALALGRLGRFEEAEAAFTAAITEATDVLGADDTRVARIRNDYAAMLGERSRAEDAEHQARLALSMRRKRLGDRHVAVAETLQILGGSLRQQGRFDEASAAFTEALAILRDLFGDRHARIATTLNSLGILEASRGRMTMAAAHLGEALQTVRAMGQGDTTMAATMATNLASILMRLGRYDEAAPLLVSARARLHETFGESHPAIVNNENTQAQLALRRGLHEEALVKARAAAAMADVVMSPGRERAAIHVTLALALLRNGRPSEAIAECQGIKAILASVDAKGDLRESQADQISADALIVLGRVDEARLHVEAVSAARANAEPALRVSAMSLRARLADAAGRPAEARREREAAKTLVATITDPDPELLRDIDRRRLESD